MVNDRIKLWYIGGYGATIGLAIVGGATQVLLEPVVGQRDAASAGSIIMLPAMIALLAALISALAWIYNVWANIPIEHREMAPIGTVTPGLAVGLFFVPCVNFIWMFMCNIGMANAINEALEAQGSSKRVSLVLPTVACILHLVPYCNFLLGPLLWFAHMYAIDRARRALTELDTDAIADVFA